MEASLPLSSTPQPASPSCAVASPPARVRRVAIERPDGPVVDALLTHGFEVVVVVSRPVKAVRERYGTAGNESGRGDAFILVDSLRTDGRRWTSLQPDLPATITLRTHV